MTVGAARWRACRASRARACEADPEGAVEAQSRRRAAPGKDRELLAQGEVLQNEVGAGTEQGADGGREGAQQANIPVWVQNGPVAASRTAQRRDRPRCASARRSRAGVGRTFQ